MNRFNISKLILCLSLLTAAGQAVAQQNPAANKQATITSGNARFTLLTPQTVRIEWDSARRFKDDATFTVINRKLPVPSFTQTEQNGWLIISTAVLEIRYKRNSGPFNAGNLQISSKTDRGAAFNWHPGDQQKENLKGTYRTLDRMNGDSDLWEKRRLHLEDGLLARDGWSLIDDSHTLHFDNSNWPWVKPQTNHEEAIDWYFMGYGHDYKSALADFTRIAGRVPMPPRYAFGYWWSRYWAYSDNELRDLIGHFHDRHIPLDVLVIDMDWHKELSDDRWTGWTFNDSYFTDSKKFLNWVHANQLKVTVNLHPSWGIAPGEDAYPAAAKTLNFDTVGHKIIPYAGSDKKFMTTLFDQVLQPLQKSGIDFWWLDWQQWPTDKAIPQLDNVWWLNYTFFTHMQNNSDKRPLIYHRWGGLGNHRYETGFSGDTFISWTSLAYQPYFTNTASNVLYGYWSHDIGGHQALPGQSGIDPELYTRWMQYGALSPVFRTHSSKNPTLNKEIWNFSGDYYEALVSAVRLRYQLAPYNYTMARKCYDTGISLCRPLYYDYPNEEAAYQNKTEYMFGDDMLVAPIGTPMQDGRSTVTVWLPPGNDWYEWHTGTLLKGNQTVTRSFSITEYPIYIKAGAVIPMYADTLQNLKKEPNKQIFGLFPGMANGTSSARLYEDNGDDQQYDKQYAVTNIIVRNNGYEKITVYPRKGVYNGITSHKDYEFKLYGSQIPQSLTVNGKPGSYRYDGSELALIIDVPNMDCNKALNINIHYDPTRQVNINDGLVEKMKRMRFAVKALKYRKADLDVTQAIGHMEELNRELEYKPADFYSLIRSFDNNYNRLLAIIKTLKLTPDTEMWFLKMVTGN